MDNGWALKGSQWLIQVPFGATGSTTLSTGVDVVGDLYGWSGWDYHYNMYRETDTLALGHKLMCTANTFHHPAPMTTSTTPVVAICTNVIAFTALITSISLPLSIQP